ncbi:MAG: hypothetical protein FJ026_17675, partial [Chloroflexi bacterium]|nr:hypothetical protein [Chloroflexota bacterium]
MEPEATGRGASSFILSEPPGYRFDPAGRCQIDVDDFLEHVQSGWEQQRRGAWTAAVSAYLAAQGLYRGDYLAEDPYADWAIPTRERLREVLLESRDNLATCYLCLGRYQEAVDQARQALDHDRCHESAWRLLMEAYHRQGEQDRALRAFERCRAVLASELGVEPLPETLALHERILRLPLPAPHPRAPPLLPASCLHLPFVGREREWATLSSALQQALEGCGQAVFIAGEPGIGKTRLLEELAGLATARGARTLLACCYELESNIAYAPFIDVLHSLLTPAPGAPLPCPPTQLAVAAELLPELRQAWPDLPPLQPLPPDAEHTRLLRSLAQIIRLSAQGQPLLLLLDDLHWADPSSLELIHYLVHVSQDQGLLLVGAYRPTDLGPGHALATLRGSLLRQNLLVELPLGAFSEEDVVLLLQILGTQDAGGTLARQLHHKTEGHPFFLAEALRALAQEQMDLAAAAEGASPDRWLLPPSVRAALLGRLDHLTPDDRAVLDHASIVGREFALSLLARFLDRPERALAKQAERLCAQGFLQPH